MIASRAFLFPELAPVRVRNSLDGLTRIGRRLWHLLISLSERVGYAFARQTWLAEKLGCTLRHVRRCLRELEAMGHVRTEKIGTSSRYFVDDVSRDPASTSLSKCPLSSPLSGPLSSSKMSPLPTQYEKKIYCSEQSRADSPPPRAQEQRREEQPTKCPQPAKLTALDDATTAKLTTLGIDVGSVAAFDSKLVSAAAAMTVQRVKDRTLKPLKSVIRFFFGALYHPARYELAQHATADSWHFPTEGQALLDEKREHERQAKNAAAQFNLQVAMGMPVSSTRPPDYKLRQEFEKLYCSK